MKKTGAELAIFALEQVGVKNTYGIPGTHTTEMYDCMDKSEKIEPILVTHEGCGAFMADATSRTSNNIGCLTIVPGAGATHAMSGMAEAFLDGIPMLIISGGVRTDGMEYQLHQISQENIVKGVTKGFFLTEKHEDIIPTIYKAYDLAISGEPGPVFVEIPVNIQLFDAKIDEMPIYKSTVSNPEIDAKAIEKVVDILVASKNPMLYLGWGALKAFDLSIKIAESLVSPVATTLQGKSSFPNSHPLFTCASLGASAKPSGQNALKTQDVLLAVGVRFAEVATGSYGLKQPKNLIHIDINKNVFDKNYISEINIQGDATEVLTAIWNELEKRNFKTDRKIEVIGKKIQEENDAYFETWLQEKQKDITSPGYFFKALKKLTDDETMIVADDGKHTFLTSELFPVEKPRHFISPTDFNCMGYCVPAIIATKLNNKNNRVIGIVGDGAVLMTGLELVTATSYDINPVLFIFNDGQLGQISQFQKIPLNKDTCTVLSKKINFEGIAITAGAQFIQINNDLEVEDLISKALKLNDEGKTVIVNVKIDYSQKTMLTKGVIKTNLKRFPLSQKIRFIARAVKRHVLG